MRELQDVARLSVPDAVKSELDLLLTIGKLWGADALRRLRYVDVPSGTDGSEAREPISGAAPQKRR
jgi:hypothetical protein